MADDFKSVGDAEVRTIDSSTGEDFIEAHHKSGKLVQAKGSVFIGLFQGELLLGVAQFGFPRTIRMKELYTVELYRLAFARGHTVKNGGSMLIGFYRSKFHPADIFTYQDTSGVNGSVYKASGMRLVKDGLRTKKQYLVAPGKTLATASRREALGMAYAVRYGSDRILGTKLGEVLNPETGERKSNKQLFIEELGWHVEETTGDSLWEWVDPKRTYYTYKITATDSDKYYYGVSHVKKENASRDYCLSHNYYGSGEPKATNKFYAWKLKHGDKVQKTVVKTFRRKAEAFAHERHLVGNLWKTDPLCLNSHSGGSNPPMHSEGLVSERFCDVHGVTKHRGQRCYRCFLAAGESLKECPIHGPTKHRGDSCYRCRSENHSRLKTCATHGETIHRGNTCLKCAHEPFIEVKACAKHGQVKHKSGVCQKCNASKSFRAGTCAIHGEVTMRGSSCPKCVADKTKAEKECVVHGLSVHQGSTCLKCAVAKQFTVENCEVHGAHKHRSGRCTKCTAAKTINAKVR